MPFDKSCCDIAAHILETTDPPPKGQTYAETYDKDTKEVSKSTVSWSYDQSEYSIQVGSIEVSITVQEAQTLFSCLVRSPLKEELPKYIR